MNARFVQSLDVDYFRFISATYSPLLDGNDREDARRASLALRMAYAHSLETFFALLFATLQAPDCVAAWLANYKLRDIDSLVQKVNEGSEILNRFDLTEVSWKSLAVLVNPLQQDHKLWPMVEGDFGELWESFAREFTDLRNRSEYNSIKHGLRVGGSGFHLSVGLEGGDGKAPAKMHSLGGSEFGCRFLSSSAIEKKNPNHSMKLHASNWAPTNFVIGIDLASASIQNVVAVLKRHLDIEDEDTTWWFPDELDQFRGPWSQHPGVTRFDHQENLGLGSADLMSSKDILATYRSRRSG